MFLESLPVFLLAHLRIVGHAKLHGTLKHHLGHDVPVGLGHNLSVETTWCTRCRGAMVLNGFLHDLDLLGREPFLQSRVAGQNFSASDMMNGPGARHAHIVIGRHGIYHILVGPCFLRQIHGSANHSGDMFQIVCLIEIGILRQNLSLYEFHQIKACIVIVYHFFKVWFANIQEIIYFCKCF